MLDWNSLFETKIRKWGLRLLSNDRNRRKRHILQFVESCKYFDWCVWDKPGGNRLLFHALASGEPQAIGKLGSTEHFAIRKYLRCCGHPKAVEWTSPNREELFLRGGVFPNDFVTYEKWVRMMIDDVLPEMTVMGVWFHWGEANIVKRYARRARRIPIASFESYFFPRERWTRYLEGKKVLVMHPFASTIRMQYAKRVEIWSGQEDILPNFHLLQIQVPQRPALVPPKYTDWFTTLEDLKQQMSNMDFDVVLVGAGAYSLPLAVHAKKLGRHGIHLGGALQIYFGIKGERWDNISIFSRFFNKYWVHPLPEDTPQVRSDARKGGYW